MKRLLWLFLTLPMVAQTAVMGSFTVAKLPAAASANRMAVVTDGADYNDCTSGSGAYVVVCRDSGSVWQALTSRQLFISLTPSCNNATSGPGSFNVPTSGAATFTCFGTTTTQGAADYVDGSSTTATAGPFRLPTGWTGVIDVNLIWFANASSANAVRWSVATGCVADTEAVSTGPSYNTASASNTAYTGTANQRKTTALTSVAVTNCSAGESMYIQVQRIGADAGDTLTATAELLEAQIIGRTQ